MAVRFIPMVFQYSLRVEGLFRQVYGSGFHRFSMFQYSLRVKGLFRLCDCGIAENNVMFQYSQRVEGLFRAVRVHGVGHVMWVSVLSASRSVNAKIKVRKYAKTIIPSTCVLLSALAPRFCCHQLLLTYKLTDRGGPRLLFLT